MAMILRVTLATAIMAAGLSGALAQSPTAAEFVEKAGIAGQFEIESSRLAMQKATSADVKKFAQQMITDHSKAAKELKATARAAGKLKFPTALDEPHKTMIADLKAKRGKDFDTTYVNEQVQAHDEAVSLFSDYSKTGDQTELKAFAAKTLPVLEQHQQHAKALLPNG
jgi:putative membrane protein